MKRSLSPFGIIALLLFPACCEDTEENPGPPDFRDAFTGTYACHKLCTYWTIDMPAPDTTFSGTLEVTISKVISSTDLLVVQNDTIPIDESGHYFGFFAVAGFREYQLDLRNDSLFLRTFSGGLGGGTTCWTQGKKQ